MNGLKNWTVGNDLLSNVLDIMIWKTKKSICMEWWQGKGVKEIKMLYKCNEYVRLMDMVQD